MQTLKEFKYPKVFPMRKFDFVKQGLLVVLLLLVFSGCTTRDVERAFKGHLRPGKANKIIGEYCQSCHIHQSFDAPLHVTNIRDLYKRPVFRKARECRSCHYIEKRWMYNQHKRKTRMPADANRGKFRKFEKKEISRLRKN